MSELHSMSDASEPGVKPVPARVTVSPPARPLQTGWAGFELSHVTPADVDERLSEVVAAPAVTAVPIITEPASRAVAPIAANTEGNLVVRATSQFLRPSVRFNFPPEVVHRSGRAHA